MMGCGKPERHRDHFHVSLRDGVIAGNLFWGTPLYLTSDLADTITEKEIEVTDTGDHDRFAHYVYDPEVPKARIIEAMIEGKPLRALCGKLWVPSRDPERYPICPDCQAVKDELIRRSQP